MPEHVPAAVRELDRVPALRTAIGQDIDRGFPLLRPEIVCSQSLFSAVYDQPSPR